MENLNEHDITRNMLKTIRHKNLITEEEAEENMAYQPDEDNADEGDTEGSTSSSDSDEEELTSSELSAEQKNFRDTVSPRVEFKSFLIYPKTKNAVFSGKFQNLGGLEWQFTLEDSDGLYISADNIQMTDDTLDTIKKLKGYYENWADEWAQKIATEYNRSDDGDGEVQEGDTV